MKKNPLLFVVLAFCFIVGPVFKSHAQEDEFGLPPAKKEAVCTQIGCRDGLSLTVDPTRRWKWGNYEFSFVMDNRSVTCRGELPLRPCEEGPTVKCKGEGVRVIESGCALPESQQGFSAIEFDGQPRRVIVRIVHNFKPLVTRSLIANYERVQPNGPMCGPVCHSASYDLFTAQ